jgi:diguanylate cyclase (GGDEF)-like protein
MMPSSPVHRMERESMNSLWPALTGIAPCLLALWYGEARARVLRARCTQLQGALEAHRDAEMRLDYIAHHDSLTGLPNRLQCQLRLEHGVAYARRHGSLLAVLFIDIDHFKAINDNLGHDAGDQVLVQFSQRLRSCVREVDTVARQGGDEFIVLLTELHSALDAQQVADKIMAAIAAPFLIHGETLAVAASIGVAVYPDDDVGTDALLEKADLAMYAAKQRGKGSGLRFMPSMQAKAYSRLVLEASLRHALEHNEFVLTYQPKLNLNEQKITGVKALIRWRHPELGLVMPPDFLPVLEDSALILPVGTWVMTTAATQARRWIELGHPLTVSVHLSPRQFYQKDIAQAFGEILRQAGVPGRYIELEITEDMLIDKGQNCDAILRQFKQLGVRISISDFGTGYASLNYLRRFPVDLVKINKCFIDDLRRSARQPTDRYADGRAADEGAMVRAIIAMAHTLNMRVVAGGVETGDQLSQLEAMGCDEAFGFCLSAAVSPDELEALLLSRQRRLEALTSS